MSDTGKLLVRGAEVDSVFELLGYEENDLTYSIGWALSNVDIFLRKLIEKVSDKKYSFKDVAVRLQEYGKHGDERSFTDIELLIDNKLFCIIEAKKGWNLPTEHQLKKYISRFEDYPSHEHKLVVISECKKEYAKGELKEYKVGLPVEFISWQDVYKIVGKIYPRCGYHDKKLLDQLDSYLKKVIAMQDKESNMVFCVSLGSGTPDWSRLSWIDIVEKKRRYFYPVGSGWPKEPPNYIAFRYRGELQSIHHVDRYEIVTKMYKHLPVDKDEWDPTFLLKLGPPFRPNKQVKNGKIYPSQHLWCMLDTLFTCHTIKEARDLTDKRMGW
jgi:hypothetical protein